MDKESLVEIEMILYHIILSHLNIVMKYKFKYISYFH